MVVANPPYLAIRCNARTAMAAVNWASASLSTSSTQRLTAWRRAARSCSTPARRSAMARTVWRRRGRQARGSRHPLRIPRARSRRIRGRARARALRAGGPDRRRAIDRKETRACLTSPAPRRPAVDRALQLRLTELNTGAVEPGLPGRAAPLARHGRSARRRGGISRARTGSSVRRGPPKRRPMPKRFIAWFEELKETGPGQGDPLFPWLAEGGDARGDEVVSTQEVAGEAGFEDLTALTQVKLPTRRSSNSRATTGTRWGAASRRACTARCWSASPSTSALDAGDREDRLGVARARQHHGRARRQSALRLSLRSARSA